MPPLVSVIMPCFNADRMLAPALRSVIAQSYPNLEIIFVDNNSTDGSADRAQSIAAETTRPFRLAHCTRQGSNHARNIGYELARGDYIQWMDADDALGIEKIERQIKALASNPGAAIAYCDWLSSRHEGGGKRRDRVMSLKQEDDQIFRTLTGAWYPPHTYLIRREAADTLQSEQAWFPERKVGTDIEYSAIAAILGMRFLHVPLARVQYNTWSRSQISGAATPYNLRVACFRDIWQRLREYAVRPEVAPRITARHKILLGQNWSVWAMPQGSVEITTRSPRLHQLRHVPSGRTIEVRPREAAVAAAMLEMAMVKAIAHHAQLLAAHVPILGDDYPFIVSTLERFRREGLLTAVALPAPDDGGGTPMAEDARSPIRGLSRLDQDQFVVDTVGRKT